MSIPRAPNICRVTSYRNSSKLWFVVTAGEGVREIAEAWKEKGDYLRSHALQALALETAEAFAELLHRKIREMWGFPDPPEMTHLDRWKARYRGVRVSFGYPACPNLEDQAILWRLLRPDERIGVRDYAAQGLAHSKNRASIGPLLAALDDETPKVRAAAAKTLIEVAGAEAVELLIGVLEEQGPNSRSALRICFRSVDDVDRLATTVSAYVAEAIDVENAGPVISAIRLTTSLASAVAA